MSNWDKCDEHDQQMWVKEFVADLCDGSCQYIPGGFVSESSFDYGVLDVARDRLNAHEINVFTRHLHNRMGNRVKDGQAKAIGYRPGDYSAALYATAMELDWVEGLEEPEVESTGGGDG